MNFILNELNLRSLYNHQWKTKTKTKKSNTLKIYSLIVGQRVHVRDMNFTILFFDRTPYRCPGFLFSTSTPTIHEDFQFFKCTLYSSITLHPHHFLTITFRTYLLPLNSLSSTQPLSNPNICILCT